MKRILRYEVPVDDQWHDVVAGEPLHVASRAVDAVEFWALEGSEFTQTLRVYGTGYPLPDEPLKYLGTAITPRGVLVWHLLRKEPF